MLAGLDLGDAEPKIAAILKELYAAYRARDAELMEINPLALLTDGRVVALDCKFALDDSAIFRQADIAAAGAAEKLTDAGAARRRGRASNSSSSTAMSACSPTAPA